MNKIYWDTNKYKNGQTIPNWTKYKFHSVLICGTTTKDIISHFRTTVSSTDSIYFNENNVNDSNGQIGFAVTININGTVNIGGNNFKENSFVEHISMWN